jgi:hypothetical protein
MKESLMNKRYGILAALAVASLSGLALAGPTLGSWFNTQAIIDGQKVPEWGPALGDGWKQLPVNIVAVSTGSGPNRVSYPICLQGSSATSTAMTKRGWVGVAESDTYKNGDVVVNCDSPQGSAVAGTIFIQKPNTPVPAWATSDSTKPEPRGAVLIATQENPARKLYACTFALAGEKRYVGYIGDDGRCYAVSPGGGTKDQGVYDVLVKSSAAGDAIPNAGWESAEVSHLPHGTLAKVIEPVGPLRGNVILVRPEPKYWTVCRVRDNNQWWPGYIQPDSSCGYFTYFGGSTQKKNAANYEVFRMGAGPLVTNYVFNQMNGAKYYACTAFLDGSGPVVGFSDNLTGCTNGVLSGSSQLKRLDLPNVDHDRG